MAYLCWGLLGIVTILLFVIWFLYQRIAILKKRFTKYLDKLDRENEKLKSKIHSKD